MDKLSSFSMIKLTVFILKEKIVNNIDNRPNKSDKEDSRIQKYSVAVIFSFSIRLFLTTQYFCKELRNKIWCVGTQILFPHTKRSWL